MSKIHFLNVLEGDCNIIQHDTGRVTVIDVSNASNAIDTPKEIAARQSAARMGMFARTNVPSGKKDYKQKQYPDNPIAYLQKFGISNIFRFIVTHPDMDHLDGIRDVYDSFTVTNTWAPANKCEKDFSGTPNAGYNEEDWEFYKKLRDGKYANTGLKRFMHNDVNSYYKEDFITILSPTPALVSASDKSGDYNDSSYVLLYTPPRRGGQNWKILFAGDSHDESWKHILKYHEEAVRNIDVLIAPHHGRDSDRDYAFLDVLTPTVTLFGNASHKHLAYNSYPETRITNNQAGYIIMDISEDAIKFYVKNQEFADDFRNDPNRQGGNSPYNAVLDAWEIGQITSTN